MVEIDMEKSLLERCRATTSSLSSSSRSQRVHSNETITTAQLGSVCWAIDSLHLDRGYNSADVRRACVDMGIPEVVIAPKQSHCHHKRTPVIPWDGVGPSNEPTLGSPTLVRCVATPTDSPNTAKLSSPCHDPLRQTVQTRTGVAPIGARSNLAA